MSTDLDKLGKYYKPVENYEERKNYKYNLDLEKIYKFLTIDGKHIVQIKTDKSYHPGAYNPYNLDDIYSALEILLFYMTRDELCQINELYFGDQDKPNTIGNTLYLVFHDNIDLNDILERMKHGKHNSRKIVSELYKNYLKFAHGKINWEVEKDKYVPFRDSIGKYSHNKWLCDAARQNLKENILAAVKGVKKGSEDKEISVPLCVFNAMHDGGCTSYKQYRDKIWAKGENIIVLGVGDFSILHGEEYLTSENFIYAALQYKNLLQKCFEKSVKKD
jgi:hypothetical protein